MTFSTLSLIFIFLGIFITPLLTLGIILFVAGHPILETIALVMSVIRGISRE